MNFWYRTEVNTVTEYGFNHLKRELFVFTKGSVQTEARSQDFYPYSCRSDPQTGFRRLCFSSLT